MEHLFYEALRRIPLDEREQVCRNIAAALGDDSLVRPALREVEEHRANGRWHPALERIARHIRRRASCSSDPRLVHLASPALTDTFHFWEYGVRAILRPRRGGGVRAQLRACHTASFSLPTFYLARARGLVGPEPYRFRVSFMFKSLWRNHCLTIGAAKRAEDADPHRYHLQLKYVASTQQGHEVIILCVKEAPFVYSHAARAIEWLNPLHAASPVFCLPPGRDQVVSEGVWRNDRIYMYRDETRLYSLEGPYMPSRPGSEYGDPPPFLLPRKLVEDLLLG